MKARFNLKALFVLTTLAACCMMYMTYVRHGESTLPVQPNENNPSPELRTAILTDPVLLLASIKLLPESELPPPLRKATEEECIEWIEKHMTVSVDAETNEATVAFESQSGTDKQHRRLANKITETYSFLFGLASQDSSASAGKSRAKPGKNAK